MDLHPFQTFLYHLSISTESHLNCDQIKLYHRVVKWVWRPLAQIYLLFINSIYIYLSISLSNDYSNHLP